jgi:hypothetical protein
MACDVHHFYFYVKRPHARTCAAENTSRGPGLEVPSPSPLRTKGRPSPCMADPEPGQEYTARCEVTRTGAETPVNASWCFVGKWVGRG